MQLINYESVEMSDTTHKTTVESSDTIADNSKHKEDNADVSEGACLETIQKLSKESTIVDIPTKEHNWFFP